MSSPVPAVLIPIAALRDLIGALHRLRPDWQRPEKYFEDRSEIIGAVSGLIRRHEKTLEAGRQR